jgi:hypothetical protein
MKDVPPDPVDLETLVKTYDFIEIIPRMSELEKLPRDVSTYIAHWSICSPCFHATPMLT